MENKIWAIYWFQCGDLVCYEEYTGENSRTFGERLKENLKLPFPIHNHSCTTCHTTTQDNLQIIGWEDHGTAKTIKESIYIRANNHILIEIQISSIYTVHGIEYFLIPMGLNKKAYTRYWACQVHPTLHPHAHIHSFCGACSEKTFV